MLKRSLKGISIITILVVLIVVGIYKYIQSTTTVEYGQLPGEQIPEQFDKVTYTITTIDEQGNENEQTFTIDNKDTTKHIVKLSIRNNKVKSHEFIDKKDVPKHIRDELPKENF